MHTTDTRLTKTRNTTTTVTLNNGDTYTSDATWHTNDGYVVHRTTRWLTYGRHEDHLLGDHMQQGTEYWVRQKNGYWNGGWSNLAGARATIAHLRRHRR